MRRSAIRPVPPFARVPASAVAAAQALLSGTDEQSKSFAQRGLERFGSEQAELSRYVLGKLQPPLDSAAMELGRLLMVAVFLAFDASARLGALSADAVAAAEASLGADEELRRREPMDALESEDIVAIEQPALVAFVNEHVGLTLDEHAGSIDVDHVAIVFRAILVEILALSQAVLPPPHHPPAVVEPLA